MKHTLLLRLAGPMQSWGTQSRFSIRDTGLEPSKSGVIGLLCAALGKPRDEAHPDNRDKPSLETLAALRMGVRVNCEGVMRKDYHTAGGAHRLGERYGVAKANNSAPETVTSERFYLADADFLVGLEGDDEALLRRLNAALERPRWQLFLGRKSFVPHCPIYLPNEQGLRRNTKLEDALQFDWPKDSEERKLRHVIEVEVDHPRAEKRIDWPLSFDSAARDFRPRHVVTDFFNQNDQLKGGR
ncbi:MAG TPA: type I-E CRISPR-associated protein Cas5/CasD [Blastocatellia bacterium]|nr:type I-E CRISPR-associated protein Cas5/CasD [Blastocatellia bacterium]